MARTVFNKSKDVNFLKNPMFFGEDLGLQRYDSMINHNDLFSLGASPKYGI